MILDGFLKNEKKDFKQKVLWKNVWVVSLDTLFKGVFLPYKGTMG